MTEKRKVAAIVTSFFPNSHADVMVSRFLRGFPTDDGLIAPRTQVASLYIDQIHERDIGRQMAHEFGVPVFESIRGALTLGGECLAVDAVLLIGEHGEYPVSWLGQEMLPRRYFFEQICGTIGEAGRPIPVFNDKHLAYRFEDARWIYETARSLGIPLWAASAVPVAWRNPNFEHPLGEPLEEAVAIAFHMVERYGFHGLEALQCQVERRQGGETGIAEVRCLCGDAVWNAAEPGEWSMELAECAVAAIDGGPGTIDPSRVEDPTVFLIRYRDGLRGAVLNLGDNGYVRQFAYAGRRGNRIDALEYYTNTGPAPASVFSYLGLNVEEFFLTGRPPTPLERTYLTTGALAAAMESRTLGGETVVTPHLEISYSATNSRPRRPHGPRPTGASLEPWPVIEPGLSPAAPSIPITRNGTVRGRRR